MCMYGATGATYSVCGVRRDQQLCLLCGVACATLVVRALVTLPLQAWSHLCSSSSWPRMARPCISSLSSSFVLRPSSHLSWAIVPYSGAPVSLCRYCTSQPQYASRELQIVRYPTRRNIACSSHPRTRQCNALKWLCRETTPKGACEGHDHYPEVGTSIRKRLCHVVRSLCPSFHVHPDG